MKTIEIRDMSLEGARIVAMDLRPQDEVEVRLCTGKSPVEVVVESVACSEASFLGYYGEDPVFVFGLTRLSDEVGAPWMLGTPQVEKATKRWLPKAQAIVEWMHNRYPVLTNIVHKKNTKSIRWLKWMGFQFLDTPVPGHPDFIQFVRYADV
jgi:hypothetical protein